MARAVVAEQVAQKLQAVPSSQWQLPSVDKDTSEFHGGVGTGYAWVQTSSTVYIFAAAPEAVEAVKGVKPAPQVELELQSEGTLVRLTVGDFDVLRGPLKHPVKPGEEIWMIEEAADGSEYVVAELEKQQKGIEWTSVMRPEVTLLSGYETPTVTLRKVTDEEKASAVESTVEHLRRQRATKRQAAEDYAAAFGDILTADMEGFKLSPEGGRGDSLGAPSQGQRLELGNGGGLPAEAHEKLVGIKTGETRDVEVTLGSNAGSLGGQRALVSIACKGIEAQELPELDDNFAREMKRAEQFAQAGTEEGIPEEEAGLADTFTMELLRKEIAAEVEQQADKEERTSIRNQLQASLLAAADVRCEWGTFKERPGEGAEEAASVNAEVLAEAVAALADREGLLPLLDAEAIRKATWDELGTPKGGGSVAEVGSDPDREYQAVHRKIFRKRQREQVLDWLQERAEVVEPAGQTA